MTSYELLPCPFCGAEAKPVFSGSCNYVTCSKEDGCWCSLTCPTSTPEEAVRIWNRRTIDRPTCHDTEERVDSFTCSSCGFREGKIMFNPFTYSFRTIKPGWKYCPNCGAEVVSNG